ncbi:MAG: xylulokinase [Proteobacteria bacterium]|nr:xylulokinase [Pseudomonadota bacterium]
MYIGIDLGTSSVKIVLIDANQSVVATTEKPLTVSRPYPLWSEQNPEQWWRATQEAIAELKKTHFNQLNQVRVIGLSGQMHGATLLDHKNQVLRPAILWNDGRSASQCQLLLQKVPDALAITGNMIMPGFTAPKILWVAEHEPEIFAKIQKILLPKDYLRLKMTGVYATDCSDASGTAWLNVKERRWSETLLAATGLSKNQMPELFEGVEITSTLLPEIAANWGMARETKVIAGGGDNAASAISMGIIQPGQAFLSLGTSGVYFVADDQYRPNPKETLHTLCHCLPNRWHQMSVHLSAASCLSWLSKILGHSEENLIDLAKQHDQLNTPLFLPYLSGERTPLNDPQAKAAWVGMNHNTGAGDLVQSVLEGVAFAFAQGQRVIENAGVTIDNVAVTGGGAKSRYWGEILATILQRPLIYRRQAAIGGAFGAARLAWYSEHGGDFQTAFPTQEIDHIIYPVEADYARYHHKQKLFESLYPVLKPVFK